MLGKYSTTMLQPRQNKIRFKILLTVDPVCRKLWRWVDPA